MQQIEKCKVSPAKICITGCLKNIYQQYEYNVNEGGIFALAEADMFYYKPLNLKDIEQGKIQLTNMYLGGMEYDISILVKNLEKSFGLKIETYNGYDSELNKQFIENSLNQDRGILSILSRKSLYYMDKNFRDDISHAINIIGYDRENDKIYIVDSYIPTNPVSVYVGDLMYECFFENLIQSKDIFGKKLAFNSISIESANGTENKTVDKQILLDSLKNIADIYFDDGNQKDGLLRGKCAYEGFLKDVITWSTLPDISILSAVFRIIHHKLTNYAGVVITNELMCEYLDYLIENNVHKDLNVIRDLFDKLSKKWLIIANVFAKCSFFVTKKGIANLCERLGEVVKLEEKVYQLILEIY